MEQHMQYALQVIEKEIVKLIKDSEQGHHTPPQDVSIRYDIERLKLAAREIKEKFDSE